MEPAKSDVTVVAVKHRTDNHAKILLERRTYEAYVKLKAAAEADGVRAGILTITSGYRSIAHQKVLWERAKNEYKSEKAASTALTIPDGRSISTWAVLAVRKMSPN